MLKWSALSLGLAGAAITWQHRRYQRARRHRVHDRQRPLHSNAALHVVTFLEAGPDDDLFSRVAALRRAIEAAGTAEVIYAGQAAFTAPSAQIGPADWDAVVLAQYASRDAYEVIAASAAYHDALQAFARHYSHGMRRNWLLNLLIPQALLGLRLFDLARGRSAASDFVPATPAQTSQRLAGAHERTSALRALAEVNRDAVVVFNLTEPGDARQRAADRAYGRRMASRFAALGHGPIHLGRAVPLEGEARFRNVIAVYYPGANYFADLLESRFFHAIIDDKQLADTQAVPTVPILPLLPAGAAG